MVPSLCTLCVHVVVHVCWSKKHIINGGLWLLQFVKCIFTCSCLLAGPKWCLYFYVDVGLHSNVVRDYGCRFTVVYIILLWCPLPSPVVNVVYMLLTDCDISRFHNVIKLLPHIKNKHIGISLEALIFFFIEQGNNYGI